VKETNNWEAISTDANRLKQDKHHMHCMTNSSLILHKSINILINQHMQLLLCPTSPILSTKFYNFDNYKRYIWNLTWKIY